jgi:hypothetical protein
MRHKFVQHPGPTTQLTTFATTVQAELGGGAGSLGADDSEPEGTVEYGPPQGSRAPARAEASFCGLLSSLNGLLSLYRYQGWGMFCFGETCFEILDIGLGKEARCAVGAFPCFFPAVSFPCSEHHVGNFSCESIDDTPYRLRVSKSGSSTSSNPGYLPPGPAAATAWRSKRRGRGPRAAATAWRRCRT